MGRPAQEFEETATYEVYCCYRNFAAQTGTMPNPHAFWAQVLKPQLNYLMPWGSFQYHWMQLQIRGLIHIDKKTKAVKIHKSKLEIFD